MKLVLASGSAWRKELLSWLKIPFEVVVSDFDESKVKTKDPEELVATLAAEKALAVGKRLIERGGLIGGSLLKEQEPVGDVASLVVIGADTVIAFPDELVGDVIILGKPKDLDHSREILQRLRGAEHAVYTGVAVIDPDTHEQRVEVDRSVVRFRDFSSRELEEYLKTGESLGRAGAYQILGAAMKLVENIEGSITNVVGLPLARTVGMLEEMGVVVSVDVRQIVEAKTGYPD